MPLQFRMQVAAIEDGTFAYQDTDRGIDVRGTVTTENSEARETLVVEGGGTINGELTRMRARAPVDLLSFGRMSSHQLFGNERWLSWLGREALRHSLAGANPRPR